MVISVSGHPFAEPANGGVGKVAGGKAILLAQWDFTKVERKKRRQVRLAGTADRNTAQVAEAAAAREDAVDFAGRGGRWS